MRTASVTTAAHPIEAHGLVKRYGDLVAVDHVDVVLPRARCLGLLGPNGAGKTTTIEMLEGLTSPDAGEIRILGRTWAEDPRGIRERIGVELQETRFPEKLTVREVLRLFASFYGDARDVEEVAALVGLTEKLRTRTVHLSGGQRQRLALGCALVNRPELLFLDEPTTGLDPQARRRVWEIVAAFRAEGGSVLLTTHYMDEAEKLADELIILDYGRVIARGSPGEIVASLGAEGIVRFTLSRDGQVPPETFADLAGVGAVKRVGGAYTLTVTQTHRAVLGVFERCRQRGLELTSLETHRPTLEDVFVALTGRQLRDG